MKDSMKSGKGGKYPSKSGKIPAKKGKMIPAPAMKRNKV